MRHRSILSYRFRPELRELELLELEELLADDELREDEDEGLETADLPEELRLDEDDGLETADPLEDLPVDEERAAGSLLGLEDEEEDVPLERPSDERVIPRVIISHTELLRVVDPLLPADTARPPESPERGRVNSIEGVLPVGAVLPVVPRSPTTGVRFPAVAATVDLVVPDERDPS